MLPDYGAPGGTFSSFPPRLNPRSTALGLRFSRKPPRSRARLAASFDLEAKAAMLNRATPPEQPETSNEVSFTFW
jgi:hypothetical protein